MKIEVNVPEGMDLDHTYQAVMDAMYNADNVSKQEVLLVSSLLNQLASKKDKQSLPNGFRDWAETHHEIVCTIHALIDNDTMPSRLEKILDTEGLGGLYDLGIDLTNEFANTYENRVWDGDWVDTIIEFTNLKLQ
jgi:archaellum biogenesis ATPase FlaH